MDLIADILLAAGALGAGFYCFILSRRLKRFNDLEKGVGGAVAVLSAQVDDLNKSLVTARSVSDGSSKALDQLTNRAEAVAQRIELMMASMHDFPDPASIPPVEEPAEVHTTSENEETDALATAYDDDNATVIDATPEVTETEDLTESAPVEIVEEESKPAAGLMFMRHNRSRKQVA